MTNPFRCDFPALNRPENPVAYLDSAATSQNPAQVIDAVAKYYREENGNPLRGLYGLSVAATKRYEAARHAAADLLNAGEDCEIIFTRNTTEALNLVACSYAVPRLKPGDQIAVSVMEHHSNLLPWQAAARQTGASLVYLYPDLNGVISREEITRKITPSTRLVAVHHVSNVLGTTAPLELLIPHAHRMGAVVVVDGAQAVPHRPVDVQKLDADFYAFSGHKMMAPMGIGVLYGKRRLLEEMPPFLTGGEMIEYVTEQDAVFAPLPEKFEAGTPNVGGAVGLHAAIGYLKQAGYEFIEAHNRRLMSTAMEALSRLPYVRIYGSSDSQEHCNILSFNVEGVHPHDVASILDAGQVAIRAGHHCAQPLMRYLGLNSCCRASFYLYNTEEDVMKFIEQIKQTRRIFGYELE